MPSYWTVNNFSYEFPCALFGRVIDFLQMKNMNATTPNQFENLNAPLTQEDMAKWLATAPTVCLDLEGNLMPDEQYLSKEKLRANR